MAFEKMLVAIAVAASANFFVAQALAQRPEAPPPTGQRPTPSGGKTPTLGPEKSVEGQVQSVNPSGTEITLTDGTTLMTPLGAAIRPREKSPDSSRAEGACRVTAHDAEISGADGTSHTVAAALMKPRTIATVGA
jgi:hypothetical protein